MKLPRSSPHSVNSASHTASRASLLRPGTVLTCRALTNNTSIGRSASHSAWKIGFQKIPVASMVTWVTPSDTSQLTISASVWWKVLYLRTCCRRFPGCWPGVRTATAMIFFPTSIAATRS
jgi:hypothetical protein